MTEVMVNLSFKDYLFHNRRNRITLYLAALAIVIQFAVFKYFYPFASYIHGDSFWYLDAADKNLTINIYPIGYSKFLRLFSVFAKPDVVLVAFQFLGIQCGVLFLLLTMFYFYKPTRVGQLILLCFMVCNPLFLYLGNMVSSDGLFLALSCTWFALLLWLIHRPNNMILFWHAVALFCCFTVRYNALLYPFISLIAFGLSKLSLRKKALGLALSLLFCGWFIGLTMYQYKNLTGYWQFSPFSGWQFANNAMYAYRDVDTADYSQVPQKFHSLDSLIRQFYFRTRKLMLSNTENAQASTAYMWSKGMPLMQYRDSIFNVKNLNANNFKEWASMGPFYREYGLYIIKKYPWQFLTSFAWPNSKKYYAPPLEFLGKYNSGKNFVSPTTQTWFGYKSVKVHTRSYDTDILILNFYPYLSGIINIVMLIGLLYYVLLKGWTYNADFNRTILLSGSFWLLNAGFTIFASSAALRFQSFPITLATTCACLLVDWLVQLMRSMNSNYNKQPAFNDTISPNVVA